MSQERFGVIYLSEEESGEAAKSPRGSASERLSSLHPRGDCSSVSPYGPGQSLAPRPKPNPFTVFYLLVRQLGEALGALAGRSPESTSGWD